MAENTSIEWTDHTFNPWVGCTKVSPGCDHCYAESWAKRGGKAANVVWGGERRRTRPANWQQPHRWNKLSEQWVRNGGRRTRVFCASLADVFDNQVPLEWREDLFELIRQTPHLDWLLLTKRIGNAAGMISVIPGWLPPNVWLGATVVDQAEAKRDIPKLLQLPARVRFLSIEPMLGPIELDRWLCIHKHWRSEDSLPAAPWHPPYPKHWYKTQALKRADWEPPLHWVICGGESGPNARPMHPDWARSLRDQCTAARVPFLFKQWGEWAEQDGDKPTRVFSMDSDVGETLASRCDGFISLAGEFVRDMDEATTDLPYRGLVRVGKKAAGRVLDGVTHDGFPV